MALTHLLQPTPAPQRPSGVTCEAYVRGEGKHCLHYRHGGGCTLPGVGGTCTEWLKVNRQARPHREVAAPHAPVPPPKAAPVAVDLFGQPLPEAGSKKLAPAPASKPATPAASPAVKLSEAEPSLSALRGLTDEDIASFKALGTEVCFASETYGEVWLVPAYTGQARKELTPEHAATLVRVLSAFPGSRVLSFEKPSASEEVSP
ncbi:hypothetical protein [Myxococcus xanthus]|uniref:hypothetical protein n=1 Tax=Myxococcus xanthus TaxID=34 RepID=UPI0003640699|nr:hypothetical protein [Myxococcus xanthus]QVW70621.1 hypothetical protein JTM82_14175 [Myxococcus xanthus DZ2]QZZ49517.1 hypothetical protein MyxoNM_09910 [Myxococcus xanthus]UEO03252.1 hypothetical protein K1515_28640 [Myxococcus xanthus DZ2]UYI16590.1 hypothetical protein N3T43_09800 [Myxococcus xanthus]UYI23952.1 hypothetical protein N1129_09805 [Myxococcus xanthus]